MWPIPNITLAITSQITFPYMPNIKNAMTGSVAPATGMPKKLLYKSARFLALLK